MYIGNTNTQIYIYIFNTNTYHVTQVFCGKPGDQLPGERRNSVFGGSDPVTDASLNTNMLRNTFTNL